MPKGLQLFLNLLFFGIYHQSGGFTIQTMNNKNLIGVVFLFYVFAQDIVCSTIARFIIGYG